MSNAPDLEIQTATDALAAALEAIDIPSAATVGDQRIRDEILVERAGHARLMIATMLGHDTHDPAWAVEYCRERLAEHPPAGYKRWAERMAELDVARRIEGGQ
jgi:hypothetical protein